MKTIEIFIADDHPITIQGLTFLIESEKNWHVCGSETDAGKVLEGLAVLNPDIIIIDILFKNSCGLELSKKIRLKFPDIPILVYSMHDEFIFAELAIQVGANGYLCKSEPQDNIFIAIDKLLKGKIYLSEDMQELFFAKHMRNKNKESNVLDLLSEREWYVFRMLGNGLTTKQIASNLNISPSTVDTYKTNIKSKLKLSNVNQLICYAAKWSSFYKDSVKKSDH